MGGAKDELIEAMENEWFTELLDSRDEFDGRAYGFLQGLADAGCTDHRKLTPAQAQWASALSEELEQRREWRRKMDKDD